MSNYYIDLSERILMKVMQEEDSASLRKELYYIRINSLGNKLDTDAMKIKFWVNIYNAYYLIMIKEQIPNKKLFKHKRIKFSNFLLSLNDIEYGILRIKKYKIGLLIDLLNSFYPNYIKELAVKNSDKSIGMHLKKTANNNTLII